MNSKQFAVVIVITFVVGMVWLISDIIFNTKASIPISDKLQSSLEPINPTFSSRVLEVIEGETLSTSEITVNRPLNETAPATFETPAVSQAPEPIASAAPVQSSPTPDPNLTPIITVPASATPSANPLSPTP